MRDDKSQIVPTHLTHSTCLPPPGRVLASIAGTATRYESCTAPAPARARKSHWSRPRPIIRFRPLLTFNIESKALLSLIVLQVPFSSVGKEKNAIKMNLVYQLPSFHPNKHITYKANTVY